MGVFFAILLYCLGIFCLGLEIYGRTTTDYYTPFDSVEGGIIVMGIICLIIAIVITVSLAKDAKSKANIKEFLSDPEYQKKMAETKKLNDDLDRKISELYDKQIQKIASGYDFFQLKADENLIANKSGIYKFYTKKEYSRLWRDMARWNGWNVESSIAHLSYDKKAQIDPIAQHIPFNKIQCFLKTGDVQYTSKVSGGGGGGYSATGAFIGGLIGGDAGAIIGSRKPVKQVKTTIETHDTRKTQLRYLRNDGTMDTIEKDGYAFYDYLLKNIPEKDLLSLQLKSTSTITNMNMPKKTSDTASRADRLRELKSLLDDGILTQEEFDTEKKKILNE